MHEAVPLVWTLSAIDSKWAGRQTRPYPSGLKTRRHYVTRRTCDHALSSRSRADGDRRTENLAEQGGRQLPLPRPPAAAIQEATRSISGMTSSTWCESGSPWFPPGKTRTDSGSGGGQRRRTRGRFPKSHERAEDGHEGAVMRTRLAPVDIRSASAGQVLCLDALGACLASRIASVTST